MARNLPGRWPRKLICAALAACFAQGTLALPSGGNVASGTATFSQNGNVLTVTNTNRAIINWGSFSIGSGETVIFNQATSSSVLNRVVGVTVDGRLVVAPSEILGLLQSPGKVFLINPAGTLIGAGAVIDVGGFVASSLMLSDADFLANRLNFTDVAGAGDVKNFGTITSTSGGNVYLIAPNVDNHGIIQAPNGEVILAAGRSVELLDSGTPGVKVVVNAGGQALNVGQLLAESGRVGMVGAVVRQQGTASTSSIVREGGRIFLRATQSAELAAGSATRADGTQGGTVEVDGGSMTTVAGTVSTTASAGSGGRIELLGDKVGVLDGALVDASGTGGGGTVLVGGDYQGKNAAVRNAQVSYLAAGATLKADAIDSGNGGKIIVWADDTTRAYGRISARGGASGGDGGFVEVSGKQSLDFDARVDTSAPLGRTGTLLLDPFSVTITGGGGTPIGGASWTESSTASTLSWSSINTQLASTNVTITTTDSGGSTDNITFDNAYSYSSAATNKLILNANDDISFANLTLQGALDATAGNAIYAGYYAVTTNGDMKLTAGAGGISANAGGGTGDAGFFMLKPGGSQIVSTTGALSLTGGSNTGNNGAYLKSAGSQSVTAGQIAIAGGTGTGDSGAFVEAQGAQTVTAGAGGITLTGGNGSLNNEAGIASDTSQIITITGGGNLQLTGGGGGASPAGSAMITAPTQSITVGGNTTLTAGNSNATGTYGMGAGAAIGWDAGSNVLLKVTGALSLSGTNAANQAVIGSAVGSASVDIEASAITTTANTTLGNWDGSMGGSVKLKATSGAISLPANSTLRTGSLTAIAGSSISMLGKHYADFVALSASGPVSYHTANGNTTHITTINATGAIDVVGDAGSTSIALGALTTTGTSNISVSALGQILDDNGSGTANLTSGSGNIALTSQVGTPIAGTLAISADVATSGQITANVSGGPYGSISIRDVGATAVNYAGLNASAATAEGNVSYFRYGDLNIGGTTTLMLTPKTLAGAAIGASGNIQVSSSLSMTGAKDLLVAGGDLTFAGGTLTMSGDGTIGAGGDLSLTGGNVSMQGADNTVFAGGLLNIGSGKTITAGMGGLKVGAGSIVVSGTLSGFGDTYVYTPGTLAINGGNLLSTAGNLGFIAEGPMSVIGSVSAAQGIVGKALGGLTLGSTLAAGSGGSISANNGVLDLVIGGTGIEMYGGSYLASTDATQANGGLIKLFFPGLGAGGSLIDGVATFDGGYKVGGAFTTLGAGLEVTYGIVSPPVANALIAATTSTTSSAGGTSQTSDSIALVSTTPSDFGGAPTATSGTQTIGDTTGTFGGETTTDGDGSSTATQTSQDTGSKQEEKNAKKKPAQCSA
ncbi:MAG: filamentous hemagglutinin N-terminal domain-containing protein [Rhodocyclales bacterium]|nr:filamentous hemagglutinin N-terminal domain-containing protein [Rhodocyclales bacterium]